MNVIVWAATLAVGGVPLRLGPPLGRSVLRRVGPDQRRVVRDRDARRLAGPKTPMLSLLSSSRRSSASGFSRIARRSPQAEWLAYLYPNIYDDFSSRPNAVDVAKGLLGTGLIAGRRRRPAATVLFERRDV